MTSKNWASRPPGSHASGTSGSENASDWRKILSIAIPSINGGKRSKTREKILPMIPIVIETQFGRPYSANNRFIGFSTFSR